MKTVKLVTNKEGGLLNQPYSSNRTVSFSTCSEIQDDVAKMLTGFYYCREGVIGHFARFFSEEADEENIINDDDEPRQGLYEHKDVPTRKTSVAVHTNVGKASDADIEVFESHMKRAIKLLNHYERRNKWFLSEIYKTNHSSGKENLIYLLKSSKWWMTSTHILSLYLLLIRLGEYGFWDKIGKSTNNSEVLSYFSKIKENQHDSRNVSGNQPKKWNVLLDNRKKIYGGRTRNSTFGFNKDHFTVKTDGVYALCSNESYDKETKRKFAELCKEAKLKF